MILIHFIRVDTSCLLVFCSVAHVCSSWKVRHILTSSPTILPGGHRFIIWQSLQHFVSSFRISLLFHRKERKSYSDCPSFLTSSVRTKQDIRLFFTVVLYFQFK